MPPQLELGAARLTFVTCLYRDTMHVSVQAHCPHIKCLYRHTVHVSHCCTGTLYTCHIAVQAHCARVMCLLRQTVHVSRVCTEQAQAQCVTCHVSAAVFLFRVQDGS